MDELLSTFERFRNYLPYCHLDGWADGVRWEITAQRSFYDSYSQADLTVIRVSLIEALNVTMDRFDREDWGYDTDWAVEEDQG